MRRRIAVVVVLVIVATVTWITLRGGNGAGEIDASGTVEATDADLGFNTPGRVAEVTVREGDRVRRGDVLARLDATELEARRASAEAQLEAARAALAEMEAGARSEELAQARAGVRAAEQQLGDAARDLADLAAAHGNPGYWPSEEDIDAYIASMDNYGEGWERYWEQYFDDLLQDKGNH